MKAADGSARKYEIGQVCGPASENHSLMQALDAGTHLLLTKPIRWRLMQDGPKNRRGTDVEDTIQVGRHQLQVAWF